MTRFFLNFLISKDFSTHIFLPNCYKYRLSLPTILQKPQIIFLSNDIIILSYILSQIKNFFFLKHFSTRTFLPKSSKISDIDINFLQNSSYSIFEQHNNNPTFHFTFLPQISQLFFQTSIRTIPLPLETLCKPPRSGILAILDKRSEFFSSGNKRSRSVAQRGRRWMQQARFC